MPDSIQRPLRTLVQASSVAILIQMWNAFAPTPLAAGQALAIAAFGTMLASFAQNAAEEAHVIPLMLKDPPPPAVTPELAAAVVAAADGPSNATLQREMLAMADSHHEMREDVRQQLSELRAAILPVGKPAGRQG